MKLKKDTEKEISFEEFYNELLIRMNVVFLENYDSFVVCTATGEVLTCEISIIYDSPTEKEECIEFVESKGYGHPKP